MTRKTVLIMIAVAAVAATAGLLALPQTSEWTTNSKEALMEFQAGLEASQKLYSNEARRHWERALELDPDFVAAKVRVAEICRSDDEERAATLLAEATEADQERLTPRERFIVRRAKLITDLEFEVAETELDAYVERYPDDPYVLHTKALRDWQRGELESAERLNKRLLEINPNWVLAYNQLGYITMLQGRFAEAEEYFSSYRFIAPDQANPHDSLGELFVILGRYEDAEASLERALANKPDFYAAFEHLAMLEALRADWQEAESWIARGIEADAMSDEMAEYYRCALEYWRLAYEQDWELILALAEKRCHAENSGPQSAIYLHQAACRAGNWELAEAIESKVREEMDDSEPKKKSMVFENLRPMVHHMAGVRLAIKGEFKAAIYELEEADRELSYLNIGAGIFKLSNRLAMASILRKAGQEAQAQILLDAVRTVNPELALQYEERWNLEVGS